MKLNILGDPQASTNEVDRDAMGGTELMKYALYDKLPNELLDKFQIIPSRFRGLEEGKKPIYWVHDLALDPEMEHLKNKGWERFDGIVCVSHWQRQQIENYLGVPASKMHVLQNAIEPIPEHEKPDPKECVNIIYHTTPHRGLDLLYPVMEWIEKQFPDINWHLDVYSSFGIYGWEERDKPYQELFQKIKDHPKMTYHGFVPNEEVHKALQKAHIFALPSIWPETSCIALIEAMSAGCICVHSSLAALPETAANWTLMYDYTEIPNDHCTRHALTLADAIRLVDEPNMLERLKMQKAYIDGYYSWDVREKQWEVYLTSLLSKETNGNTGKQTSKGNSKSSSRSKKS